MKAIVQEAYGPADVLQLRDVERPSPRDDEVLVEVRAAGVGPDVWHLMAGNPYMIRVVMGLRRPRNPTPGWDVAGRVVTVGARVRGFEPGDEVLGVGSGTFAELARAKASKLTRKPPVLSFAEAAAIPVSGTTALQALRDRGKLQPGQRVLVIGASGGVGSFAVQLAKREGAHVTGMAGPGRTGFVRSLGADDVLDYAREEVTDRGERYDLIVDTAGNRPLPLLRRVLTPKGTLVIVGAEGSGDWLGQRRQARAMLTSPFVSQRLGTFVAATRPGDLALLAGLAAEGAVRPILDRTFPLADAAAAVRHLREGHPRGKVVLTVEDGE